MQPVFLLTDIFVYAILVFVLWYIWHVRSDRNLRANWRLAMKRPVAMVSSMVLGFFLLVAFTDSIHYRKALPSEPGQAVQYSSEANSVLDEILQPLATARERSYSEPLSAVAFRKETFERDGVSVRDYPRLRFGGKHLDQPELQLSADISKRTAVALGWGACIVVGVLMLGLLLASYRSQQSLAIVASQFINGKTEWPWRSMAIIFTLMTLAICWVAFLSQGYHVFGTDRTGNSVLVFAMKSVRTALVIGGLTTLVVLPLALLLGVMAGYLRGWVDEVIQYVYTLLASIPDVLLIAASVLLLQVFIAEAVLSYVGVGVDPKTASFGVMINTARAELAATPLVWWSLTTAFGFMFLIVLSANLLADAIRDAFDPRTRLRSASSASAPTQEVAA